MSTGTTQIEVANKALLHMGHGKRIASLTDDDDAARALQVTFDLSRRAVLRSHFWNFAGARAELALDATTPAFDWPYRYRKPGNYIGLREMFPREARWVLEGDYFLSDSGSPLQIIYTFDQTNLGSWDPLALEALAAHLAYAAAYRVTGSREVRNEMWSLYRDMLREARHMDAMEGESTRTLDIDVFQDARLYGGSAY